MDSDNSTISTYYDSGSSYSSYSKQVDKSSSPSSTSKSPSVSISEQIFSFNNECISVDAQEDEKPSSLDVFQEYKQPITSLNHKQRDKQLTTSKITQNSDDKFEKKLYNLSAIVDTSKKPVL